MRNVTVLISALNSCLNSKLYYFCLGQKDSAKLNKICFSYLFAVLQNVWYQHVIMYNILHENSKVSFPLPQIPTFSELQSIFCSSISNFAGPEGFFFSIDNHILESLYSFLYLMFMLSNIQIKYTRGKSSDMMSWS